MSVIWKRLHCIPSTQHRPLSHNRVISSHWTFPLLLLLSIVIKHSSWICLAAATCSKEPFIALCIIILILYYRKNYFMPKIRYKYWKGFTFCFIRMRGGGESNSLIHKTSVRLKEACNFEFYLIIFSLCVNFNIAWEVVTALNIHIVCMIHTLNPI